jgi:hypothetical protein
VNKHNAFTMPPDPAFSRALKKSQWGKSGGEAAYKTADGKAIAYGMRTPANKSTKPKEKA